MTPPPIDEPNRIVRGRYGGGSDAAAGLPPFDIDLFEQLNREYSDRRIVAEPPGYEPDQLTRRARQRIEDVDRRIGLRGRRVLEFGCGAGYEVWHVSHGLAGDAYGVDVAERAAWSHLADERTHYVLADMAESNPFRAGFFDRIVSFTVLEHVSKPYEAIAELHRVLKRGGVAWITANLYRGPLASHRYREVHFPYPHLLFTNDVFREFYRRRGMREREAAWVNKLTWEQYEAHFRRVGFRVRDLSFREAKWDEDFYRRFEPVLGRYPRQDLVRDFFAVTLEKPR